MLRGSMRAGAWQHAHFLFLRSLRSMPLALRCDFVAFELSRGSPHTAALAVALALVPRLARSAALSPPDRRAVPRAARVGAAALLRCDLWRSAMAFARASLLCEPSARHTLQLASPQAVERDTAEMSSAVSEVLRDATDIASSLARGPAAAPASPSAAAASLIARTLGRAPSQRELQIKQR